MINKIAIISDTHNNFIRGEKVRDILKKEGINFIIHCGDIGEKDYLKKIFKKFEVRAVLGNADDGYGTIEEYQELPNIVVYKDRGEEIINNKRISFNHYPEIAKKIAKTEKYDFVFYGQTHKPWEEKIGKTILLNPGNVSGILYNSTFAIYDFKIKEFKLIII